MSLKPHEHSNLMYKAKRLEGLQNTKHFGAQRRARHKNAKAKAIKKAKGENTFPF